jgi:predicted  nucleic acid-binding Zn-ribbon protein
MKIIDYEESIPVKEEHIEQLESQLAAIDERLGKLNEEMVRREALEAQVPRLSKEVESTLRRHAELETELHQLRDLEQATSA